MNKQSVRKKKPFLNTVAVTAFSAWFFCGTAFAARVVFFSANPSNPTVEERLKLACRFYGIDLVYGADAATDETPTAAVIEAGALGALSPSDLPANNRALLIAGITFQTSEKKLREWAGEPVASGRQVIRNAVGSFVTVSAKNRELAAELVGQKLPVDIAEGYQLTTVSGQPVISYQDGRPLFVRVGSPDQPVFLLADLSVIDPPNSSIRFYDQGFFAEIAPYLMFLRNTFREYGWHADHDYANLTIDDPWLCRSYGNLDFQELLNEMGLADFHTTIAYIPWNYDQKSAPEVLKMFRDRPDRFSLCVHGNNHDHREFYSYEPRPDAEWPARPLADQDADLRQGLARIARFEQGSGLSVDRVMVFPHGIAPDPTLGLLKRYNYKATSNAGYVPLDTPPPEDSLFWLRRVSDRFGGGFASLDRTEPANRTSADIAIDLFLDNPVLFVEHLRFFSGSRAAFNPFAREVNTIQPDVHWVGLGSLIEHLYLMRLEDDGTWTVHSFSPEIVLENPDGQSRRYRVLKSDDGRVPVAQVLVDGADAEFTWNHEGLLVVDLSVPPYQQRRIQIVFENNFAVENEDLSKPDRRVNMLRYLSSIRDQYLTAGPLGALIDRYYYNSNLYHFGMKILLPVAAVLLLLPVLLFVFVRKKMKRRHG
ncbi:hypothetical protein [Tichowtungia aerotolerans]|uniref:Uncharacterized protein n=1 Tax=Tichowtungia aerotolerans TaxID=2697043 RepID=A0A6P1MGR6_9BACT|nr:hypothetical protein [Tichowtungia aerotolerans]QHI70275.1 hypothetical protein GT409_12765 [Tichowtungia aerotolerans]